MLDLDLSDRVVVITGASHGLGSAFAKSFAENGASLGLLARDESALINLAESLPADAVPVACDVTKDQEMYSAFRNVAEHFGRIDSVIANAGALLYAHRAEDLSAKNWREVLDLNLTGAFITARHAFNYLRASGAGRLVFISSGAAKVPIHGMSAYSAAKAGVEALVRALCIEWASSGICVNAISPGFIDDGGTRDVDEKSRNRIIGKTTLRRPGAASDLIGAAHLLVSDASAYITGQILCVDGGYGLR